MSEIKSFSDYTSKYNSNVDFSALFSGTSDSSSVGNTNMLSDYAAIKNGSYRKLMKAYYACLLYTSTWHDACITAEAGLPPLWSFHK